MQKRKEVGVIGSITTFMLASVFSVVGAAHAAELVTSPYARGGVVSIVETDTYKRYVHTFTNAAEAATFRNKSSRTLHARILVVGAGGAGGYGNNGSSGGGGGGGGGGVLERKGVDIAAGAQWTIRVGKGATATTNAEKSKNETAGASSISNGVECVAEVPGGGNGGESQDSGAITKGHAPTAGAAGGGGIRASTLGAAGTYPSSILGVECGPFSGGNCTGTTSGSYTGGGGGAGAAGNLRNGGMGLASDITGVSLVYGSGGGGGGSISKTGETIYEPGNGGTRAGKGASGSVAEDQSLIFVRATDPEANSGGGGGGGLGGNSGTAKGVARYGTSGADGIVIVAYEIRKIPFVGGEVKKIAEQGTTATYIHVFSNAKDVATFENVCGDDVSVRMLVVGAGGAGGYGLKSASGSGGGGGGGGVFDAENITMPADGVWTIRIGKGATATTNTSKPKNETAGASSISNGVECVAEVPGGGNGAESTVANKISTDGHEATAGAAGGGGIRGSKTGAVGTYASSILGVKDGPFAGGDGTTYQGGGGGGAGAAGTNPNGGEGLSSDITGESLVYGSGGGSGGNCLETGGSFYSRGLGGTRAGNGAEGKMVDSVPETTLATKPIANSGCGGAGGLGGSILSVEGIDANVRYGTSGANGIVVIRYDWTYDPNPPKPGLMLLFK